MDGERRTVLIVDDEEEIVEVYARPLAERYAVKRAYDGAEALELLDGTVDVVLLDRRMPGLSGDEVLARIRERGYDVRVAIVTAVEPDFDIVEMGFDAYLSKPIDDEELRTVVDELVTLSRYDGQVRELFGIEQTRTALKLTKSEEELAESEEYRRLTERREELMAATAETVAEMTHDTLRKVLSGLDESRRR